MRLTLRTMLCYLDDVLEPSDAKELGAKIQESEFASNMVHRIRTSMRRQRLGAPRVGAEGTADANMVACYLDNTLPPDQVPDFERVCLDPATEMQLAEVAACHQVLTLVLGEPADVPPAMRQRMYRFGTGDMTARGPLAAASAHALPADGGSAAQTAAAASAAAVAGASAATAASADHGQPHHRIDAPEPSRRSKPEVPEYLKAGARSNRWPLALTLVALVALVGAAALAIWPSGRQTAQRPSGDSTGQSQSGSLFDVAPTDKPKTGATNGKNNAKAPAHTAPTEKTSAAGGKAPPASGTQQGGTQAAESGSAAPPAIETPAKNGETAEAVERPADADPAPAAGDARAGEGTSEGVASAAALPAEKPADETPALPPADVVVGHYTSTGQVLAHYDAKENTWQRVPARAALKPGMQLRTLPTYRPQILLENAIQLTFSGDGAVNLRNPAADDVPSIEFPFGRLLVATIGKAGNRLAMRVGERDVLLTMANADAALAVEATRFHSPGDDPQAQIAHVQVTAVVTGGQVQWQEGSRPAVTLDAGQAISFLDEGPFGVAEGALAPKWAKSGDATPIDVLASEYVEQQLPEDRAIELTLEELAESPRVELRSLAVRGLAALDHFDRLVESFSDEKLKSYWAAHFDYLRQCLARGQAAAVKEAFTRRKGDEAEKLYRILWGYSPKQLAAGGGAQLVEHLKSTSLDARVLAFNALERITKATHGFRPERPESSRLALREWERALAGGGIVYKNPPAELPARAPAAPE